MRLIDADELKKNCNISNNKRDNRFQCVELDTLDKLIDMQQTIYTWIPADEPPEDDRHIFLSFANSPVLAMGRYEEDEKGCGNYYVGDDDEPCLSYNLIVNAWMELPKRYRGE